jgi:hypothetical protein
MTVDVHREGWSWQEQTIAVQGDGEPFAWGDLAR